MTRDELGRGDKVNRTDACSKFIEDHPDFIYGHAGRVFFTGSKSDRNVLRSIRDIANDLIDDENDFGATREEQEIILSFLAGLLALPAS